MLSAINDVPAIVESVIMGLDIYHRPSSSTKHYQPTRANADRDLLRLKSDLTNVTK